MASDVECITLDDSDDDSKVALHQQLLHKRRSLGNVGNYGVHGVSGHQPRSAGVRTGAVAMSGVISVGAGREETMMRCNLCVGPGLLPVEEDRCAHRSASAMK